MLTSKGEVVGIKDPYGFRPLCLGKLNGHYILASETCALDLVQAEFIRELDPGEIVIIGENGIWSIKVPTPATERFASLNLSTLQDRTAPSMDRMFI